MNLAAALRLQRILDELPPLVRTRLAEEIAAIIPRHVYPRATADEAARAIREVLR